MQAQPQNVLEKVGANPIFDQNIIGLVAQFAVRLSELFICHLMWFFFSKM